MADDRLLQSLVCQCGALVHESSAGYHRQAWAENAFFRYRTVFGDRLRARPRDGQAVEARMACDILNRMAVLGRPKSCADGAIVS